MLRSSAIAEPFRRRGEAVALRLAVLLHSAVKRNVLHSAVKRNEGGRDACDEGMVLPGLMDGYEFVYPAEECAHDSAS